jgi:hypothetical protein
MLDACRRLETIQPEKDVYTDRDIDGLGKNLLREVRRKPAILAYRFFIRYYALLALKEQVQSLLRAGQEHMIRQLLLTPSSQAHWEHARRILCEEFGVTDVVAGLGQLPEMLDKVASAVECSKARDHERGVRIIDDYADVHIETSADPIVRQTWDETRRWQHETEGLILQLQFGQTCDALAEPQRVAMCRPKSRSRWRLSIGDRLA